jgi:hypothetical protein
MPLRCALLAACIATPLLGGYAATELWVPVVGRAQGAGGREFFTTIYVTNTSDGDADVMLSFFVAAQPGQASRDVRMRIKPSATATHEVQHIAAGSLRISAASPVTAVARIYSRGAGPEVAAVLNAIPSQFAIGSGESTILHGSTRDSRYKLYVAETHALPLYFSVTLEDVNGKKTGSRRLYVGPHEQRSWDFTEPFDVVRVEGINGSGKIVVAGSQILNVTQDSVMYEMLLPAKPRHRIGWPEWLAWAVAAGALVVAGLRR